MSVEPSEDTEVVRLAKLVKVMRDWQKAYFSGDRKGATMAQCKDMEGRVDKAVGWVLRHRQGTLPLPETPSAGPYEMDRRLGR